MSIFKRVEVWVLLALALGAAAFVLFQSGPDDPSSPGEDGKPVPYAVDSLELTRDYGNAKLDIELTYDNRSGSQPIESVAPDVRVLAKDGEEVDAFFLAGSFPAPIPPGRKSSVTLSYWLQPRHLDGPLWIDIKGNRVRLKSDRPFDLETMENQSRRTLSPDEW